MRGVYFASINLKIGDIVWQDDTERMMQIDHLRLVSNTGSVVIEIYDETAIEVETELLKQTTRELEFWYGYSEGEESDHYVATATKITPLFSGTGVLLTIEGIPTSAYKSASNEEGKAYTGTPSEIVRQVAADEGWDVDNVIDSIPIDGTSESYENSPEFTARRSINQSAEDFIVSRVAPYAQTSDGKGNFQLVLEENTEGMKVSFYPAGTVSSGISYTYVIGEKSEEVISFEPQYGEFLYAIMGSNGGSSTSVDSVSNEELATSVEVTSFITAVTSVAQSALATAVTARKSSTSQKQQEVISQNVVESLAAASYQATLTLKGKPNIEIGKNIEVKVFTKDGVAHFSSGEYMVQSVEDLIEGDFKSILTLIRAGQLGKSVNTQVNVGNVGSTSGNSINYTPGAGMGKFKVTAYCSCKICCGQYSPEVTGRPSTTRSGTHPVQGRTIAVDPSVIPLGEKVIIDGHTYIAEDTGGAVKGNHIDMYFSSHQDAVNWGVQYKDVYYASEVVTPSMEATGPQDGTIPESVYYTACRAYLGIPYVWGGEGPSGYDCSGFVWALFKQLGFGWGRTTAAGQATYGTSVPVSGYLGLDNALPGDLLFNYSSTQGKISHVMCYLGNGYMVHAPHTGDVIKIAKVYKTPYCIRRLL